MIEPFEYTGSPARIVFGPATLARAEDAVTALGCTRALVLSTPNQAGDAHRLADALGALAAGVFA